MSDDDDGNIDRVAQSLDKLISVQESLRTWIRGDCRLMACTTELETLAYRCRCSFQILHHHDDASKKIQYGIRKDQTPIVIASFPIANRRIQTAMAGLLDFLNTDNGDGGPQQLRTNLASATFSSSWRDEDDADCLLTLNYSSAIDNEKGWYIEARQAATALNMRQVTGRSRKRFLRAITAEDASTRDTVWLCRSRINGIEHWNASLSKHSCATSSSSSSSSSSDDEEEAIPIYYDKPEDAFYHPNSRAMCHALSWMIHHVSKIKQEARQGDELSLLEMYCGCGAHTMALAQCQMLTRIVAVELDERLVTYSKKNIQLNHQRNHRRKMSQVDIVLSDAGKWAGNASTTEQFNILLVDPPRQGLDERVCAMACSGRFQHFLYISCGREALIRDLDRLSTTFEVIDCMLLDLFPRTTSVESLVYLRRKSTAVD